MLLRPRPDNLLSMRHLYVHIPYCHRICPYCAFFKHLPGDSDMSAFVDALLREAEIANGRFNLEIETIYFGGGTPTLLNRKLLDRLLRGLHARLDLGGLREWTMEANPATFDSEKAGLMREHGVSRISLGVQSWQPGTLEVLGRDHSPDQAERAYRILRAAGFPIVSIDLMFAMPRQTSVMWQADLDRTISLQPDHVSCYNLTYEQDTAFFEKFQNGEYTEDQDENANFFAMAMRALREAGFDHYEISNYARPGFQSIHNRAYWSGADYLGLGPGAVSTGGHERWKNVPDTNQYVERIAAGRSSELAVDCETLTDQQKALERIALELRTTAGLPLRFLSQSGAESRIESLRGENLVEIRNGRAILTDRGKMLADSVTAYLV